MKVALCCIERLENKYIREFVEYYKKIGVDHIFMYDTNDEDEDHIEDVIGDFINDGYVEKIEWHLHQPRIEVLKAYEDCCNNRLDGYDWCCFFDPDEYLTFKKCHNIKEYIQQDCFSNSKMIVINWINMNDAGMIYYENKPLLTRFNEIHLDWHGKPPKKAIDYKNWGENFHIKCILNCHYAKIDKDIIWKSPHRPTFLDDSFEIKNSDGEIAKFKYIWQLKKVCDDNAYLKHFRCKTIEEYITNKIPKLSLYGYDAINFDKKFFFLYNHISPIKSIAYDNILKKYLKKT